MTGPAAEITAYDRALIDKLRRALLDCALVGETVTYSVLAERVDYPGPHRIHRLTELLEVTIREDHAAGRPLLAAMAVSRAQNGIPGRGFFQLLAELGRYHGPDRGPEAEEWYALERDDCVTRLQAEQEAYVKMVYWLSGFMTNFPTSGFDRNHYPDHVGLEVTHGFQSNKEEMAFLLDEIGILEGIPVDPAVLRRADRALENMRLRQMPTARRFLARCRIALRDRLRALGLTPPAPTRQRAPTRFRFVMPRGEVTKMARQAYTAGAPDFEEVLNCFIHNAVIYDSLPEDHTPFRVPEEFFDIVELLRKLGYATRSNVYYRWTNAIGPAMHRIWVWPNDSVPEMTPEEEKAAERAAQYAADAARKYHRIHMDEMPEDLKREILKFFADGQPGKAITYLRGRTERKFGPFRNLSSPRATYTVERMYEDWLKENTEF